MIEAMWRALKVLENKKLRMDEHLIPIVVDDLRQAIEQAEKQEPVAWVYVNEDGECEQIEYGTDGCDDPDVQPLYTAPPSKPWVSLNDRDITGAAHNKAKYPVSILETTDSGLCMQFSETGEWHASDKHGDFMKVNSFLMSFARAIEAKLKERNNG